MGEGQSDVGTRPEAWVEESSLSPVSSLEAYTGGGSLLGLMALRESDEYWAWATLHPTICPSVPDCPQQGTTSHHLCVHGWAELLTLASLARELPASILPLGLQGQQIF